MGPPIVHVALAYGAGLWVGLVFLVPEAFFWLVIPVGLILAVRGGWRGALCAAAILGTATGEWVVAHEGSTCRSIWQRGRQVALLRLQDAPGSRPTAVATVQHASQGCGGELRLRLDGADLHGGVRIVAVGTYRGAGVFRVMHLRELVGGRSWRYALRDAVAARVRSLYGSRAGLVEAVILGRKDGIEPQLRASFAAAGLAHLLAISGLHVGVLGGWILLTARLLGARRHAWLFGCVVVWCYVALLGFPAPATRAAAFISIMGLSRVRQRHPPPNAVLAVALLVVLAVDPAAATSVGAWLSAAAVWGTRTGSDLLPRFRLLGASIGATIATAPITAWVFGAVAPIGVIANLAAVPLASMVVPGLFASLFLGDTLAAGTGLMLAGLEGVANICAGIPGGHLVGPTGPGFAAPWVLVLAVVVWVRSRRPSLRTILWRLLVGAALGSWGLLAVAAFTARESSHGLALHFIAVGQGDAIAVRTPRGAWVLVDGGPRVSGGDAGRRLVVPFLRRQGVTELNAVLVSHGDADHLGGMPSVIRTLTPKLVLDPGQPLGTGLYLEYLETIDAVGSEWRPARSGDEFSLDSVRFEVIHPTNRWLERQLIPNENSLVVRITHGCFTALLAGDIGLPAESALVEQVGEADLLKVGHHGSAGSTGAAWLDAVQPRAAVVSVGPNRYGHPAESVMERLRSRRI
ncbi:MAG: DNA internalization-related competence protein ComEC/Rec2, partial [Gemmatimonadota bacterium]